MKSLFMLGLLYLIVGCAGSGARSATTVHLTTTDSERSALLSKCRLFLQASRAAYAAGEAVDVKIILENDGDRPIGHLQSNLPTDIPLQVSSEGKAALLTAFGGNSRFGAFSARLVHLQPGHSAITNVRVSQLYDMSEPGEYSIVARCDVFEEGPTPLSWKRLGTLVSDSLTIKEADFYTTERRRWDEGPPSR